MSNSLTLLGDNFIDPIKPWKDQTGIAKAGTLTAGGSGENAAVSGTGSLPFADVFSSAIDQVKTTQADVENKQYLLATGQLEDAHTLPIAEAKAQVSLDMLITLRNKALESYNELLKINM
ncbi:MAG: flagellar hook-basal body complex protein FliE [Eubacterium sp.]|nr:flagellar hook-basal body complex protein FliE [Eubacterium sp.]